MTGDGCFAALRWVSYKELDSFAFSACILCIIVIIIIIMRENYYRGI